MSAALHPGIREALEHPPVAKYYTPEGFRTRLDADALVEERAKLLALLDGAYEQLRRADVKTRQRQVDKMLDRIDTYFETKTD